MAYLTWAFQTTQCLFVAKLLHVETFTSVSLSSLFKTLITVDLFLNVFSSLYLSPLLLYKDITMTIVIGGILQK